MMRIAGRIVVELNEDVMEFSWLYLFQCTFYVYEIALVMLSVCFICLWIGRSVGNIRVFTI